MDTTELMNQVNAIDWLQPSWDMFIIVFFLIISLVYGFSLGRDRILVTLISVYMSLAVIKYVPYITEFNASLSVNDSFALRISVFLGAFVFLFFILSQSAVIKTLGANAEQGGFFQVLVFSVLHAGLLVSVALSFFPHEASQWLSPLTRNAFISDPAKAAWIVLPILAMVVFGRGDDWDRRR